MQAVEKPCISMHLQTSRLPHESDQNRIRFKNAVDAAERSLKQEDEADDAALLKPLRELGADDRFFVGMLDGLSVFRSPSRLEVRRLPFEVRDFTVVADSFHVKPFIRALQYALPYRLLCVSVERVKLYEGNRYGLREVVLDEEVPTDMGAALGGPSHVAKTKRDIDHPEDSDQRDSQLRRYFRRLDEAVAEYHAPHGSDVPLMLAALPEYHAIFQDASHNPNLLAEGIRRDAFKGIDDKEIAALADAVLEPVRRKRLAKFKEMFGEAMAHDRGSDDLEEVAKQAIWGKVDTVALRRDLQVGGKVDPGTGEVTRTELHDPAVDDLTDDIAEAVLKSRGRVMVLDADDMPSDTGVAAILRQ